jgi:hypothetical protein
MVENLMPPFMDHEDCGFMRKKSLLTHCYLHGRHLVPPIKHH